MKLLNQLSPADGSKTDRKRRGRGIGSGLGKTGGRGHKGQKARKGGYHKVGFEGGQMPIHRRLPKRGFRSPTAGLSAEVRLSELEKMKADAIDLASLKAEGVVSPNVLQAKIIKSGELTRKLTITGVAVTKGAKVSVEAVGGTCGE